MKMNPQISPQTIARLRAQFGLARSLGVRYGLWLQSAVHGDFGYSFAYNSPVSPLLKSRVRNTALLAGISTVIAWLFALGIGIWSAMRASHCDDRLTTAIISISMAVPYGLIALPLLLLPART